MTPVTARLFLALLPTMLVGTLSGCSNAFNPIGTNTYDCNRKQDPSSIYCHSFRAVEASTHGELPDSRFDRELKFSQYDKATEIAPVGEGGRVDSGNRLVSGSGEAIRTAGEGSGTGRAERMPLPHAAMREAGPLAGMPVREGPVVQRVWIKHFVDGNDMLTGDTMVYKEIISTRWAGFDGGNPATAQRGVYPHRLADAKPATANKTTADSASRTDFIQPGDAPVAAENSPGTPPTSTMPQ
jgi:hypothetical protein